MTAVTTDCIVPLEHLPFAVVLRHHADAHAVLILRDGIDRPADPAFDAGKLRHPVAQHALGQILRDPLAVLEIVLVHHLAKWRRVPVFGAQVHVRRHPAQGKTGWQHAGGTYLLEHTPGIEMLHGPLLEPLPLRDAMLLRAPLDDRAGNSALRELDRHRHADRTAADNHDLPLLLCRPHVCSKPHRGLPTFDSLIAEAPATNSGEQSPAARRGAAERWPRPPASGPGPPRAGRHTLALP